MKATRLDIPDVILIEPDVFGDERGFFFESFNQRQFDEAVGYHVDFVQDNHSRSKKGVLRGLHYQLPPNAQGKLVRVIEGEIFDVAVDLRRKSKTFGHWVGALLSKSNNHQLWVPEGFGHGFLVTSNVAEVIYKVDDYWSPECERSLVWDDENLNIEWPFSEGINLSNKDMKAKSLNFLIQEGELF